MLIKHAVQLLAVANVALAAPSFGDWFKKMLGIDPDEAPQHYDLDFTEEALPEGLLGDLYRKFKPDLRIDTSKCCTPYPAVNAKGWPSHGADGSDKLIRNCQTFDKGQIYARWIAKDDPLNKWHTDAIMYSWYFLKIQDGGIFGSSKRHDWQQIVVWLSSRNEGKTAEDFGIDQVSYSRPDGYKKTGSPSLVQNSTTNPLVLYEQVGAEKKLPLSRGLNMISSNNTPQGKHAWEAWTPPQEMVAWEKFTPKARAGVNENNYPRLKMKTAPFSDDENYYHENVFVTHLKAAFEAVGSL